MVEETLDPSHTHLARARMRARRLAEPLHQGVDLDALRGWTERRDPALASAHVLPSLARLVLLDSLADHAPRHATTPLIWELHAPELLIGRYHISAGPIDLTLHGLLDHELYKIGAPHIRLSCSRDEPHRWTLTRISPSARTLRNDQPITRTHVEHPIYQGDRLTLGVTTLRFECEPFERLSPWQNQRQDLLKTQPCAALFLKRAGALCGPRIPLDEARTCVIGRSFPATAAPDPASARPPDWDLSGLFEHERRHIAPRHAALRSPREHEWELVPLSQRHRTTLNRVDITEPTPLSPGDEIGLGNVLFHFHHPDAQAPSRQHTIRLPHLIDWHAEYHPTTPHRPEEPLDER